ncbi:MAG: hypothetical protein P8X47_13295 [Ignavibacteriaceae bacterium]
MIDNLINRAARFIVKNRVPEIEFEYRNFSSVFTRTYSFLIIMPENERDFRLIFPILEYLKEQRKNIVVLTHDFRISLLAPYFKTNAVSHGIHEVTKLNLPSIVKCWNKNWLCAHRF